LKIFGVMLIFYKLNNSLGILSINHADLLSINKIHFKLSKLGIKLKDDDSQSANEFDIYELNWRDNSRVVVLQITHVR
jgi:hypothetical protein